MTLVIFARCQDGCVLASDRKATLNSGFGEDESKSRVYRRGWAIAGAGDGLTIQTLITRLEEGDITRENVEGKVLDILREYYRTLPGNGVSCIVLSNRGGSVQASVIEVSPIGSSLRTIESPYKCIGEEAPLIIASHYIEEQGGSYGDKLSKDAAVEILAILQKASKGGSFVGTRERYGFDIVLFKNGEYCYKPRDTTEYVILTSKYRPAEGASPQYTYTQFENGGA